MRACFLASGLNPTRRHASFTAARSLGAGVGVVGCGVVLRGSGSCGMVPMWSLAIERGTTLRQRSVLDSGRAVGRPCDATGRGTTTERSVLEGVRRSTETVRDACDTPLTHGKGQRSVSHHPSSSVGLQQSSSPKRVRSAWPRRRAEPRGKSAESMTPSARGEASKGEFYPPGLQDLTRLRVRCREAETTSRPVRVAQ